MVQLAASKSSPLLARASPEVRLQGFECLQSRKYRRKLVVEGAIHLHCQHYSRRLPLNIPNFAGHLQLEEMTSVNLYCSSP